MRRTTAKAMRRGNTFEKAIGATRTRIVRGWVDRRDPYDQQDCYYQSEDEQFAEYHGLHVRRETVPRTFQGHVRMVKVARLDIPPFKKVGTGRAAKKGGNVGFQPIFEQYRAEFEKFAPEWNDVSQPPNWRLDPVVETSLPDGRTVYLHTFLSRLVQISWVMTMEPHVERALGNGVHGYRPGRSPISALRHARQLVRQGYTYAVQGDIRSFFDSLHAPLIDEALRQRLPEAAGWLRRIGLTFLYPKGILLRPGHPRRRGSIKWWLQPTGHILQGGPASPMLANVTASHVLDEPFRVVMEDRALLLRYADDFMIMARTAADAAEGLTTVDALLNNARLVRHPEKGFGEPRDLMVTPTEWLGKTLHGGSVMTSDDKLRAWARELVLLPEGGAEFYQRVKQILAETVLDGPGRVDGVFARELKRLSRDHKVAFDGIRRHGGARRGIDYDSDHVEALDDFEAGEAV